MTRQAMGLSIMHDVLYSSAHPEDGTLVPRAALSESPIRAGTGPGSSVPPMPRQGDRFLCRDCLLPAASLTPWSGDHGPRLFTGRTPGVHVSVDDGTVASYQPSGVYPTTRYRR